MITFTSLIFLSVNVSKSLIFHLYWKIELGYNSTFVILGTVFILIDITKLQLRLETEQKCCPNLACRNLLDALVFLSVSSRIGKYTHKLAFLWTQFFGLWMKLFQFATSENSDFSKADLASKAMKIVIDS